MNILQVHNYYDRSSPSGENIVVDMERDLLRKAGHQVAGIYLYNDEVNKLSTFKKLRYANNWLGFGAINQNFKELVRNYNPDIVHIHNTFPFLGANVLDTIQDIPSVFTVHNYRLSCINGLKLRNGVVCNHCDSKSANILMPTLNKCYRNSAAHSLFASYGLSRLRGKKYFSKINHFIALTEFQKRYLVDLGVPNRHITVKPNAYHGNYSNNYNKDSRTVLFVGRLSQEKGILNLISAWKQLNISDWKLKIIGSGPLSEKMNELENEPNIKVCGKLSHEAVMLAVSKASFIVVPSLWYEGYPMVIREAIARGIPSLVSEIGSTASAVTSKIALKFNPTDPHDFTKKLSYMINNSEQRHYLSKQTKEYFDNFLESEKNTSKLQQIYKALVNG